MNKPPIYGGFSHEILHLAPESPNLLLLCFPSCHRNDFFWDPSWPGTSKKTPAGIHGVLPVFMVDSQWMTTTNSKKWLTSWMSLTIQHDGEYLQTPGWYIYNYIYIYINYIYIIIYIIYNYVYIYICHSPAEFGQLWGFIPKKSKPRPSYVRPLRGITWKQGGAWDFLQGNKDGKITNKKCIDIYSIIYSYT